MSFHLSFHRPLLDPTGAHWLDELPDLSSKDSTGQYAVDDPLRSCLVNSGWTRASPTGIRKPQVGAGCSLSGCFDQYQPGNRSTFATDAIAEFSLTRIALQ
jgi:hypothetical protein